MSTDIQFDSQVKRLNAAVARFANVEVEWLKKDMTARRDIRQPCAADAFLLTGALEHTPSSSNFDGSDDPNVVLTTIEGYKQQIELVPVIPSTYKVFGEAVNAVEALGNSSKIISLEKVTKLIDAAHVLVDDLEDRMKQRDTSVGKKSLPRLTDVQLLVAWNQVCELYQRGAKLDESIAEIKHQLKAELTGVKKLATEPVVITKLWFKYDSANYEPRILKPDSKRS
ncbi:hypothetical protein DOTSEDRAFT_29734 [Dothistroma septosporum NZE10]|uniref:Uncharacterized protein n=1 Tax=Dothistroma septosporum (strain NZE10 / CBS 128990) TaxID=675120 RepID=M2YI19_DOTSN|nr:hypothetical protein DOTSEDRAFT_29734 [Dothistroma septosporum NZE10]